MCTTAAVMRLPGPAAALPVINDGCGVATGAASRGEVKAMFRP